MKLLSATNMHKEEVFLPCIITAGKREPTEARVTAVEMYYPKEYRLWLTSLQVKAATVNRT